MADYVNMDAKIQQGFSNLSKALFPDATKVVQARMMGARSDLYNAQADKTWAEQEAINQDLAARSSLSQALMDPRVAATPEGRAMLAAHAARQSSFLKEGTGALVGASTFVNPDSFGSPDGLSNALVGSGVVKSYANTPTGFAQDQSRQYQQATDVQKLKNESFSSVQQLKNQGAMDLAKFEASNTMAVPEKAGQLVNGRVLMDMNTLITTRLAESVGADPKKFQLDPALKQKLLAEATNTFQKTKNLETAVQSALDNNVIEKEAPGYFIGNGSAKLGKVPADVQAMVPQTGGLPPGFPSNLQLPSLVGGAQAARPTPAAPAPQAAGNAQGDPLEGRTATGPGGQKIVRFKGQWVDMKTGAPVQ